MSFHSNDLDEARSIVSRHFYVNFIDMLQPSAQLKADFNVVQLGGVTVGNMSCGTDVRMRFGELGAYHVDVPLSGKLVWRQGSSRQMVTTTGTAAVFQPAGDTVLDNWAGDCRVLAVKIDRPTLETELERMLGAPARSQLRLSPTLDVSRGPGRSWARLARQVAETADHPMLGAQLRESLVRGLLLASDHQYRSRLTELGRRAAAPLAVRRVIEAIHDRPDHPFTVSGLAELAGIGERWLQEGFQRHVGMSPMAYLREVRLGRVHEELRDAASGAAAVSDIAYRWGFVHLGRFAAMYRQRYGVNPLQTLRSRSW